MVAAGLVGIEARGKLGTSRTLGFLGDASYSIYLLHYIPLTLLAGLVSPVLAALVAVAVGCLAYLGAERPMLRALKSRVRKPVPA
jgi:peptidoglycan/LPS O-acetylase OafA/YrhL